MRCHLACRVLWSHAARSALTESFSPASMFGSVSTPPPAREAGGRAVGPRADPGQVDPGLPVSASASSDSATALIRWLRYSTSFAMLSRAFFCFRLFWNFSMAKKIGLGGNWSGLDLWTSCSAYDWVTAPPIAQPMEHSIIAKPIRVPAAICASHRPWDGGGGVVLAGW